MPRWNGPSEFHAAKQDWFIRSQRRCSWELSPPLAASWARTNSRFIGDLRRFCLARRRISFCGENHSLPRRINASTHYIEKTEPHSRERQKPRLAAIEAKWRALERNFRKGIGLRSGRSGRNTLRHFLAEQRGHRNAVARVSHGVVQAVHFSGVRHHIERKIERAAPNVVDFCVSELGKNSNHIAAENRLTFANRVFILRKKCGAPSEEHSPVRRQPVIVRVVERVVDHAIARTDFCGNSRRQNFRDNDV